MGFFGSDSEEAAAHDKVVNIDSDIDSTKHKAPLSHELIAAAASYEAAKAYEKHKTENGGKPSSHAKAKEILAGFAGAFVDKIVESKGLDYIDKEKAKRHANQQLHDKSSEEY